MVSKCVRSIFAVAKFLLQVLHLNGPVPAPVTPISSLDAGMFDACLSFLFSLFEGAVCLLYSVFLITL